MIVLGLTGSIGMGKTTAARMLGRMGVPVHDSDAAVHRLMARGGGAVPAIEAAFPDAVRDGQVDRRVLGQIVFGDPARLAQLEAILHPMVTASANRFMRLQAERHCAIVALDIPLLLETGQTDRVDHVVVVSAPDFVQRSRVLARKGMTAERLDQVLARQMPDREKRRRADAVVPSGLGRGVTWRSLARIVDRARAGMVTLSGNRLAGNRPAGNRPGARKPPVWPPGLTPARYRAKLHRSSGRKEDAVDA